MTVSMFNEAIRKSLVARGDEIGMRSPECLSHRSTHENCSGCQYKVGCSKYIGLKLLSLSHPRRGSVEAILAAVSGEDVSNIIETLEPLYDYGEKGAAG